MWSFVITDRSFVPIGELMNAKERKVALPLNRMPTLSAQVRLDNPLAEPLVTTAAYVKAYRNGLLRFFGPIITSEEKAGADGSPTVAVNAVGAAWFLQKRLAGKSATGTLFTVATDRAQIVKSLIDTANAESETGIDTTRYVLSSDSAITYTAGPYRPILDIISELSAADSGFDWDVVPEENYSGGVVTGTKIASIRMASVFGVRRDDAVFEYGSGVSNIAEYTRTTSREGQANKVYHAVDPQSNPSFPVVSAENTAAIRGWKMMEDLASADLTDATLRQSLVNAHVATRANPRQVIQFTPHIDPGDTGRLPQYGVDYLVGDTVRARATYNRTVRFDGFVRVWGAEFTLDDNGVERTVLTLVPE